MKSALLWMFLLGCWGMNAQYLKHYNRFSAELQTGIQLPILVGSNFSDVSVINLKQFQVSGKYMFDRIYGIKVHYGLNQFKRSDGKNADKYERHDFHRFGVEGVISLTQSVFTFYRTRDFLSIQVHGGTAVTFIGGLDDHEHSRHHNLMAGMGAALRVNRRLAVLFDATLIGTVYKESTVTKYDDVRGFSNISVGIQYNFGPHRWYADWH